MPIALLAAVVLAQDASSSMLVRGGEASMVGVPRDRQTISRFWTVEDTYLESRAPTRNAGGGVELLGGPGKTILIRFADLRRWVGPAKVTSARLEFTVVDETRPELVSVARVLVPWGEGPANTLIGSLSAPGSAPVGSATWQHRRAGTGNEAIAWQQDGALGRNDALPIEGVTLQREGSKLTLSGLEEAVQTWLDRPYENHGLAIRFTSDTAIASSQAATGRPRLVLEHQPVSQPEGPDLAVESIQPNGATWVATIRNRGNAPVPSFRARWILKERAGGQFEESPNLAPGATTTLEVPRRTGTPGTIALRVEAAADADPSNDFLLVHESARALKARQNDLEAAQAEASLWNDAILPQSRFSFAPAGATERVRIEVAEDAPPFNAASIPQALGLTFDFGRTIVEEDKLTAGERVAKFASWRPGFLYQDGDTRFDGAVPGLMSLNYDPIYNPLMSNVPMEATGLLTATQVAQINSKLPPGEVLGELPGSVILKVVDRTGQPIGNAELTLFQSRGHRIDPGQATLSLTTGANGSVLMPNQPAESLPSGKALRPNPFGTILPDGSNGVFLIRAQVHGISEWNYLPAWQLVDAASRGAKAAAIHEIVFNLPNLPLEDTNLAKGRFVGDSEDRLPAQAANLVDDDPSTGLPLNATAGSWIEIDLGRDRPVGEVQLVFGKEIPSQFEIILYATGQRPEQMNPWNREMDAKWAAQTRRAKVEGDLATFTYRGTASRVRYVRIRNVAGEPGDLREVRVISTRTAGG